MKVYKKIKYQLNKYLKKIQMSSATLQLSAYECPWGWVHSWKFWKSAAASTSPLRSVAMVSFSYSSFVNAMTLVVSAAALHIIVGFPHLCDLVCEANEIQTTWNFHNFLSSNMTFPKKDFLIHDPYNYFSLKYI